LYCGVQEDYELLSALDEGLMRRTPLSEEAVAALPTHRYRANAQVSLAMFFCNADMPMWYYTAQGPVISQ
jgi:hypothetical protein